MSSTIKGRSNRRFQAGSQAGAPNVERRQALADRKDQFEALNNMAMESGDAWLISVAGDFEVMVEALPESTMPARLQKLDYRLRDEGPGQRIIPTAITETISQGSSRPPIRRIHHAGIVETRRWSFML